MSESVAEPLVARLASHLRQVCVSVGPRPGGSPANAAAADYIAGVFQASGLAVERQEFACPAWEEVDTCLSVQGLVLPAVANRYSPSCNVAAPGVLLGTMSELEVADLEGKVGVLWGELAADPLSPKSWFLISEREQRLIALLEEKRPAALITIQPRLGELERLINDPDFHIPSVTVPARAGLALLRARQLTVRLSIASRRAPGSTWNVIGRRAGSGNRRVALCAHYDTAADTPGALDNGGGVATLLALAETLGPARGELGLECIAFGNEDSVPEGTAPYMDAYADTLGDVLALFNFDGVGHALDVNTVALMAHSPALQALAEEIEARHPWVVWTEPWPESNHSAFAWRGVPSLAFTSRAARYLAHLRADSIEWASPRRLAALAAFVADVVEGLRDKEPGWTRPPA
ncbi:MAG: M28 family metallopeptidase [Chloroflexota bacterium]